MWEPQLARHGLEGKWIGVGEHQFERGFEPRRPRCRDAIGNLDGAHNPAPLDVLVGWENP